MVDFPDVFHNFRNFQKFPCKIFGKFYKKLSQVLLMSHLLVTYTHIQWIYLEHGIAHITFHRFAVFVCLCYLRVISYIQGKVVHYMYNKTKSSTHAYRGKQPFRKTITIIKT